LFNGILHVDFIVLIVICNAFYMHGKAPGMHFCIYPLTWKKGAEQKEAGKEFRARFTISSLRR